MKGTKVAVSFIPENRMFEGIISGTPKPGTMMQLTAATEPIGGRHTYATYAPGTGDGTQKPRYILLEDWANGKTFDDAYVSGTRCFLAQLVPGDEVNVRKADISGTGSPTENMAIGDKALIVDGTGKISDVAVGNLYVGSTTTLPIDYPFEVLETIQSQLSEILVWCRVRI